MNRPINRIGIVLRKELSEIFRDRRTTFAVIVSPLVITPALLGLMGAVIRDQTASEKQETYRVALVGAAKAERVARALEGAKGIDWQPVDRKEAEQQVKSRQLRAALVLPDNADALLAEHRKIPVTLIFDQGNDRSVDAADRLRATISEQGGKVVKSRLKALNLSSELADPFDVKDQPLAGGGTVGMFMLSMFLPYVLAISGISGGLYAANDLVAGEKERGTLETLLATPASRRDIVMGKFLSVATVCLLSSFLSVVGLMIPFFVPWKGFEWLSKGGLHLSGPAVVAILLVQIPLAILFAGLLIAISTNARNQKEAQSQIGPLLILVMVPAMMSMMLKAESAWTLALIPVLNATLVLKQALASVFDVRFITIAVLASAAYAGIALLLARRLFENEKILLKA